jgi:hypothetical protein
MLALCGVLALGALDRDLPEPLPGFSATARRRHPLRRERLIVASQRDLDLVDEHIAEADERIGRQRDLVEELHRDYPGGSVVQEGEQLLSKMIDGLEEMKEHRRVIIEDLQRSTPSQKTR